jgi:hypothetical protein
MHGRSSTGSYMGEILNELFKQGPDIIGKAAQSPLRLASLGILVLGALGFLLLRDAAGKLKLLVLAMIRYSLLRYLLGYEPSKIHKIDHRFILWADPA